MVRSGQRRGSRRWLSVTTRCVLSEQPVPIEDESAAELLAEAWLARDQSEPDAQLLRRLEFAGQSIDVAALVRVAAYGARALSQVHLVDALEPAVLRALDRDAPTRLQVPSGRTVALTYNSDGTIAASVKLQELFGLAETPQIGPRRATAWSSRCSRRMAGRSRSRATCAASGNEPIRRCARNCAGVIRSIRGPTIPGPPSRRPVPGGAYT